MNIREMIEIEQGQYLHRNAPTYTLVNLITTCILAYVFRHNAPRLPLMLWVSGVWLLALYRLNLWRRFRSKEFTLAIAREWLRKMLVGPAMVGVLWAGATFSIVPVLPVGQQYVFFYTFVLFTLSAVFNYSAYYPTYLCIFLPFGIAVVAATAAGLTTFHPLFAGTLFLFVLTVPLVAWRFNRIFLHSLTLRFENLELVQQLTRQKETAEAANLAKSRFLAAASHDLRQPMHAINLYLGTLAGTQLARPARELLGKARQCGETMDDMFRALLDMSRLDAAAVQPDVCTFPIAPVLERIQVQFEPEARAKGLRLRVVPSSALVRSDVAMLQTVLRNFVANALRYTEHGKILVGCRRRGSALRLAVYDTGYGIPADKQRAVFEEFYQLGNSGLDRSKGLGLGLAIVERLAKLLGMTVELISRVGHGSMFAVDLPCGNPADLPAFETGVAKMPARTQLKGAVVAVIDDEEPILDATRTLLEQWGCHVVTATSGREAIERLIAHAPPDVLLCDYRLRGDDDGVKVVDAIRSEFNADIPAVFVTGNTAPDRIGEIHASDIPVLYKPIEEQALRQVMLQVIARYEAANTRLAARATSLDPSDVRPAYDH